MPATTYVPGGFTFTVTTGLLDEEIEPDIRAEAKRRQAELNRPDADRAGGQMSTSGKARDETAATGITVEAAIAAYLADCEQRNHARTTMTSYRRNLMETRTRDYMAKSGVTHLSELADGSWLRAFLLSLREAGLRSSTANTYFRTWHSLLIWCADQELIDDRARVFKVKPPRISKQEPTIITEGEEQYLLGAAHCDRDRFILRFMLRTGLRRMETLNLDVDDILRSPSGGYVVRVRQGKGGKDRRVPLDSGGHRFSDEVEHYIGHTRPRSADQGLFLTREDLGGWGGWAAKKRGQPERLTSGGLYMIFRRLREETGIDVSPHKLRHTFATRAIAAGVPAFALQAALGHTTLEMTKRYVHYSTEHLEKAWADRRD